MAFLEVLWTKDRKEGDVESMKKMWMSYLVQLDDKQGEDFKNFVVAIASKTPAYSGEQIYAEAKKWMSSRNIQPKQMP